MNILKQRMVINIQKLILDFDLTIVNSIKKIVELYDLDFQFYKDYKKIHWTDINTYGFEELTLINKDIVLDYFDDHRFFYKLDYMDNALEVLDKLKDKYDIIICSMGRQMNLHYKREWINNHLPYAKFIGIDLKDGNKKSVDMSGAIILDDNIDNLHNCNADVKLIFGDEYPWNTDNKFGYHRCYNFTEVEKLLLI